jgi:hypothetical protein
MTKEAQIIEAMFRIPTKEGLDVDFKLLPTQLLVDESLTGRDLVPKARQEGVSSYVLARFLAACLMYRNTRAVVISHDMESTQRLLARVRYYIDNMKGATPVVQNMSKNEITFPKMNSMFYLGTAGSRQFGRGDTITHLHCSEYAFWPGAPELMKGLLQAVPQTGEIIIESTGNGFNDYYRRCMRSYEGKSVWSVHFLPWQIFPEYQMQLDAEDLAMLRRSLNPDWEEPTLFAAGITLQQLAWRRMKLDELDYDLNAFKQEYPRTLDECFQMSSESVFHKVLYEPTDRWKRVDNGLWILDPHPIRGYHYTLGGDPSGGVGKDSSVVEVYCLETNEQVAEYTNNRVDPELFAEKIATLSKTFNKAFSTIENNNHGILTIAVLRKKYPEVQLYSESTPGGVRSPGEATQLSKIGYRTTVRSKPLMIGKLRSLLANEWTIHSPLLKAQLSTFIEHENGRMAAQEGCEDDAVIASACAGVGLNKAALLATPHRYRAGKPIDPFALDHMLEELRGRDYTFPISYQDEIVH